MSISGEPNLREHLKGNLHAKKTRLGYDDTLSTPTNMTSVPVKPGVIVQVDGQDQFRCEVCSASISGRPNLMSHLSGKQHKDAMKKKSRDEGFCCKVCCIDLESQSSYDAHVRGKSHDKESKEKNVRKPAVLA